MAVKNVFLIDFNRDLFQFEPAREKAIKAFNDHRDNMHPITLSMIEKDLKEVVG